MTRTSMTVVLCEGYHDRAFLSGVLVTHLGWIDARQQPDGSKRPARDQLGAVGGGDFGYRRLSDDHQLRVRPCEGDSKIPEALRLLIEKDKPFDRLVICYDGDKGSNQADFLDRIHQSVEGLLSRNGLNPVASAPGRWSCQGLCREALALVWHCGDRPTPGVPEQQCLERVVCAAAAEVWPERLASLAEWLRLRPSPSISFSENRTPFPKSNALTLVGGWFAKQDYQDFLKSAWSHPEMAAALRARLVASGAWAVLESLSQPIP
jgi:hypothetical protein